MPMQKKDPPLSVVNYTRRKTLLKLLLQLRRKKMKKEKTQCALILNVSHRHDIFLFYHMFVTDSKMTFTLLIKISLNH